MRLLGLLVHLSFLAAQGRASTSGMWRCLAVHRTDPVQLGDNEAAKAAQWHARLTVAHAAPMSEHVLVLIVWGLIPGPY